jgi:hypothetical protein
LITILRSGIDVATIPPMRVPALRGFNDDQMSTPANPIDPSMMTIVGSGGRDRGEACAAVVTLDSMRHHRLPTTSHETSWHGSSRDML